MFVTLRSTFPPELMSEALTLLRTKPNVARTLVGLLLQKHLETLLQELLVTEQELPSGRLQLKVRMAMELDNVLDQLITEVSKHGLVQS